MRIHSAAGALLVACSLGACAGPAAESAPAEGTGDVGALELADLESTVEVLHEKFTALAEAMPADDLAWRPMEGARSVQEVFVHVAADNWFVPALMGWDAPAGTGVTSDGATFQAYQSREMTREEMLRAVDDSFRFFRESMATSTDDLGREVTLGSPTTVGDVWIRAVVHLHEHLGQSIAYARSNEVVPPWSR